VAIVKPTKRAAVLMNAMVIHMACPGPKRPARTNAPAVVSTDHVSIQTRE
jgi:hypothetical protein